MKKILKHLFLMLMLSAGLVACNTDGDDTEYLDAFGTVEMSGLKKYIKLDYPNKLASTINFDLTEINPGTRLFFYYSVANAQELNNEILNIRIESQVYNIPTKNVNIDDFAHAPDADTLGKEIFYNVGAHWVSGDYLTTIYSFYGSAKAITYMKFDTKGTMQPTDTIQLEFSRKEKDDASVTAQSGHVSSFKLDYLREYAVADSVVLAINYKISSDPSSKDTTNKVAYVTYKW